MARPSQNLDRALLEAGFAELERGGVRGLSVRAVCARAGVNVRMLNYHFGSKDEFVRQLLNKTYQYFFNELSAGVRQNGAPLDRLACALRAYSPVHCGKPRYSKKFVDGHQRGRTAGAGSDPQSRSAPHPPAV